MNRLLLAFGCILICVVEVFGEPAEPKPLCEMSAAERDQYAKFLKEYYAAHAERERLLQEKEKADPAFARAAYWLKNEQLGKSTQYRTRERAFKATLSAAEKEKYDKWLLGFKTSVGREAAEKEWNDVPASRPALLFVAEYVLAEERMKAEGGSPPDAALKEDLRKRIQAPKSPEEAAKIWSQALAWSKKHEKDTAGDWEAIGQELHIPAELKEDLRKEVVNWGLFNVYDTYYRIHAPPELFALRKQATECVNQLANLRPGWEFAEGLAFPEKSGQDEPGNRK